MVKSKSVFEVDKFVIVVKVAHGQTADDIFHGLA